MNQELENPTTNEEIIQTLRAARERLFTTGWRQGELGPQEGPNCVIGAINEITKNYEKFIATVGALGDALNFKASAQDPWRGLDFWNDKSSTTFDDVVDVFDLAIKELESKW